MKKETFTIEPVTDASRGPFCACLEEWSEEIREAGTLRSDWYEQMKGESVGDQRKKGVGKALLLAAEEDLRRKGVSGITAWGLSLPIWMKASWFKKYGYRRVDRDGMVHLMWKPLNQEAAPPRWRKPALELKEEGTGEKLKVLSVINGICSSANIGHERTKRLIHEYSDRIDHQVEKEGNPETLKNHPYKETKTM